MARNKNEKKPFNLLTALKEETRRGVMSIVFFVFVIFFVLAAFDKAGVVGGSLFSGLNMFLGVGYFILPLLFILLGVSFFRNSKPDLARTTVVGAILFFLSGLGIINIFGERFIDKNLGGMIGNIISKPMLILFDFWISIVVLIAIFIISISIMFDKKPSLSFLHFRRKEKENEDENIEEGNYEKHEEKDEGDEESDEDEVEEESEKKESSISKIKGALGISNKTDDEMAMSPILNTEYSTPPLTLLAKDSGKPGVGDIKANSNVIKRTLQNFGITVEMDEVSIGPSVTRYALKPAEGVKISRIIGLQNDLALALAAHPLRIEAPIPGKSLVGIEIPNNTKTTVGLGTLLAKDEYNKSTKPLLVSLGRGISGKSHFADITKMPHMLIAGATGSGKSVTIHILIMSLLFRNPPENIQFIMIDPKRVELTLYNKIPHLLTPVVTNPKKAILALKWAAKEMDRRYDILESESVRDILSYHKNVYEPALKKYNKKRDKDSKNEKSDIPEKMPYIVVIIDELADIMMAYPRELESAIVRLAQMSRAVGIHLILSTQRPSVNVITGLIKANIPTRIALQVASQIDSRTILDAGGAEKLLGAGDMLYMSGEMGKPIRIQSAFISENEVKKVVKFLVDGYGDEIPNEIILSETATKDTLFESGINNNEEEDELYEEAKEIVIQAQKASSSYLQRKLKIGYARAARLLDILEERDIVGPADGSKARNILEEAADHGGNE